MEKPFRMRQSLEDVWRERAQVALTRYRAARTTTAELRAQHAEWLTPTPDGSFAVTRALRVENAALSEYRRVLVIFNDLVIHGKMPPDESGTAA